jgi:flagellar export protein FliJ
MTQTNAARFRYPLQMLVKKHGWDVDTLSVELKTARQALHDHQSEAARLRQALQRTNAGLVRLRADGEILDLTRERVLINYRQMQEEAIATQLQQLQAAAAQCDQIVEQLNRARQALQGFEKHSDRLRATHALEAGRVAARDADDAWLVTHGWKGNNL